MAMEDCILALYYKSHLMIKILGFVYNYAFDVVDVGARLKPTRSCDKDD